MAEDLIELFTRLRHDVVADIEAGVETRLDARLTALRDDMSSHFDAVYKRLDRLESEYGSPQSRHGTPRNAF